MIAWVWSLIIGFAPKSCKVHLKHLMKALPAFAADTYAGSNNIWSEVTGKNIGMFKKSTIVNLVFSSKFQN